VVASLIGFLGDFDRAEEAAQEAFAVAAERWPRDGTPDNPGAWLVTTARNRAIDRIRRERVLTEKTKLLEPPPPMPESIFADERLELVFTCCHPALALDAQVALTLRTLGGLSTDEIARAFSSRRRRWRSGSCGRRRRSRPPAFRSASRPTIYCRTGSRQCSPSST